FHVTGVQTCALPIFQAEAASLRKAHGRYSLPCASLHYASRLNLGVRRQETGMDFLKRRAAHSSSSLAKGIGAGLGFGAAIGLIIGNAALGIAIGVGLGAAIGARRGSHSSDEQGS